MKNSSKFIKQLSLVYFAVIGWFLFLSIIPALMLFAAISLLFPIAMSAYYFVLLYAAKFYIFLSPLKFSLKEIDPISDLSHDGFMVVANHRSHLDMFIMLANVYKLRAVANSRIFRIPILGQMMKMSKHFSMKKGDVEVYKKTLREIKEACTLLHAVLFFPEMTRCDQGEKGIQKFRLTAFQIARENNIQIIPVVISGTDYVWPRGKREMDFRHKISIVSLEAVSPNQFSSSAELSQYVHDIMEKKLLEITA